MSEHQVVLYWWQAEDFGSLDCNTLIKRFYCNVLKCFLRLLLIMWARAKNKIEIWNIRVFNVTVFSLFYLLRSSFVCFPVFPPTYSLLHTFLHYMNQHTKKSFSKLSKYFSCKCNLPNPRVNPWNGKKSEHKKILSTQRLPSLWPMNKNIWV